MKLEILTKNESEYIQKDIISKIRDLINLKNLEPGDKLPSERSLSEKFGVTRSNVRDAIQKLEHYGLLKSMPQSGTFVANIGVIAMNGMIEDILQHLLLYKGLNHLSHYFFFQLKSCILLWNNLCWENNL